MTRRDRAAMRLALEVLRRGGWTCIRDVRLVLVHGDAARELAAHVPAAQWSPGDRIARLLRARLALYLRALLRADAGDYGRAWCSLCGPRCPGVCECWDMGRRLGPRTRRYTPLWERRAGT